MTWKWPWQKLPPPPPLIQTPWGPVSEVARKQAALNIAADPVLREAVIALLMRDGRSRDEATAEARRRYPEGFPDA
jgi:hypothetical protein